MIIVCTNCSTKFKVPDEKIKGSGIKVRCSKCKNVFKVSPPASEPDPSSSSINLDFDIGGPPPSASPAPPTPKPEKKAPPAPKKAPPQPAQQPETTSPEDASKIDISQATADDLFDFDSIKSSGSTEQPAAPPPQEPKGLDLDLPNLDSENPLEDPLPESKGKSSVQSLEDSQPDFDAALDSIDQNLDQLLQGSETPDPLTGEKGTLEGGLDFEGTDDLLDQDNLQVGAELEVAESSTPVSRVTDDGIQLTGNLDGPDEAAGMELSLDVAPPENPPMDPVSPPQEDLPPFAQPDFSPNPTASPQIHAKENISMDDIAPFKMKKDRSGFFKFFGFLVLFAVLISGLVIGGVYWVHGRFAPNLIHASTLQQLIAKFSTISTPDETIPNPENPTKIVPIEIVQLSTTFVQNIQNETILVITGEAKNISAKPQSFIRIKALIYNSVGQLTQEKEVWAGNTFSREEMYYFRNQEMIDEQYSNTGKSLTNMNIRPDSLLPFQILILNPDSAWHEFKAIATQSQEAPEEP